MNNETNKVQINVNNNTDSVVQITKSDDEKNIFIHVNDLPKSEEWPAVGDEVITASVKSTLTANATVLAINDGEAWIKYHDCGMGYNSVRIATLSKPPTPEDELKQLAVDIWNENNHDFGGFMDIFVNYIHKKQ